MRLLNALKAFLLLKVMNSGDLIDEFASVPVDGFMTNSVRAAEVLRHSRPTAYIPLAVDDEMGPVAPVSRYRSDVVYMISGGRGDERTKTIVAI